MGGGNKGFPFFECSPYELVGRLFWSNSGTERLLQQFQYFNFFFKKLLTVLRGPLAYPNGLLDLDIDIW
jgi:hypothetical protein